MFHSLGLPKWEDLLLNATKLVTLCCTPIKIKMILLKKKKEKAKQQRPYSKTQIQAHTTIHNCSAFVFISSFHSFTCLLFWHAKCILFFFESWQWLWRKKATPLLNSFMMKFLKLEAIASSLNSNGLYRLNVFKRARESQNSWTKKNKKTKNSVIFLISAMRIKFVETPGFRF